MGVTARVYKRRVFAGSDLLCKYRESNAVVKDKLGYLPSPHSTRATKNGDKRGE